MYEDEAKKIVGFIMRYPGMDTSQIAYHLDTSAYRIDAMIECYDEAMRLARAGKIAMATPRHPPAWALRLTPEQRARVAITHGKPPEYTDAAPRQLDGHPDLEQKFYAEADAIIAECYRKNRRNGYAVRTEVEARMAMVKAKYLRLAEERSQAGDVLTVFRDTGHLAMSINQDLRKSLYDLAVTKYNGNLSELVREILVRYAKKETV
ncbi:MAG: hypothetical protein EOP83_00580 [Verrucomicrobiaceae bacterium]|nr:MAG: hypothetical protein EOP83_00580 [Verrucomicrobiaceae bacterium]